MLRNYLVIAVRFFSRQRGFSIINIAGLTIGIACSLLILLFIQDEFSYDRFHEDYQTTYRVAFHGNIQGKPVHSTLTGFPVAAVLKQRVPSVVETCRLASWATLPVRRDTLSFTEPYMLLADSNFFSFFTFKLLEGNPSEVLRGEAKMVLSESAARKYFGYEGKGDSPVGKKLSLAQGYTATITGIAEDPPVNSHFHYSIILSLESWERFENRAWLNNKVLTYFKIGSQAGDSHTQVLEEAAKVLHAQLKLELGTLGKNNQAPNEHLTKQITYSFQPLGEIHLRSHLADEIEKNGDIQFIYIFSSIAAFITVLACINFMNLTTARSASRAKEVAVRKSVGAQNGRLITQFLLESYFYVIIAVIVSFLLVTIGLVPFNYFTEKHLTISSVVTPVFIGGIILFVGLTGLIAGSYPAFYLTNFSPIQVLKGDLRARLRTYGIRNALVVFQFFISTSLIIATLVMHQQLQYIRDVDVGFNKKNIINLLHTRNLGQNALAFKNELRQQKDIVVAASYANRLPPNIEWQAVFRTDSSNRDYQFAEQGTKESIRLVYRDVSENKINIEVKGNTLHLYLDNAKNFEKGLKHRKHGYRTINYEGAEITAYVTYTNLQSLEMRGNQQLTCLGPIVSETFVLKAYGENLITLSSLKTDFFKAALYGENKLRIKSGKVIEQKYRLYGENMIDAEEMKSAFTTTSIFGEGDLRVNSTEELRVNAFGEPQIFVNGGAQVTRRLIFGKADITRR